MKFQRGDLVDVVGKVDGRPWDGTARAVVVSIPDDDGTGQVNSSDSIEVVFLSGVYKGQTLFRAARYIWKVEE